MIFIRIYIIGRLLIHSLNFSIEKRNLLLIEKTVENALYICKEIHAIKYISIHVIFLINVVHNIDKLVFNFGVWEKLKILKYYEL